MSSHHDALFEAILRGHLDDLEADAHRRWLLARAREAAALHRKGPTSRSDALRCRLARTLVALARRLDPEAGLLSRSGGTPSRT